MSALLGNANAAMHLANARRISRGMRDAGEQLRAELEAARDKGASWQAIAEAAGAPPRRPEGSSSTAMRRWLDPTYR